MFHRTIQLTDNQSYFLFGPRGTGKSTLLRERLKNAHFIDLLDPEVEDAFHRSPGEFEQRVKRLPPGTEWVVIDEIQKAPRLLDSVHRMVESFPLRFVLTGSSARKLKRGGANLLAGRAFVHHLHPLTHRELGTAFDLKQALCWGGLPRIYGLPDIADRQAFLRAYTLTYLREEIVAEQLVRRLDPFRQFLEVAAQCNGQIINYSKVARDIAVDTKTVQTFFEILEDTLIGVLLPPTHRSVRKRQRTQPKFYLFDPGVKRALDRTLEQELLPQTWAFGQAFEHFVIVEALRLASYSKPDWRFSYLRTKDDAEIDLVIDRPGMPTAWVEIKSTDRLSEDDLASFRRLSRDLPSAALYCLSRDPHPKMIDRISCLPWNEGLREIGL